MWVARNKGQNIPVLFCLRIVLHFNIVTKEKNGRDLAKGESGHGR